MAQPKPMPLESRVLKVIREQGLIPTPQRILVAVSGGPDSVCLLHALYLLRDELKIDLHIAHLNHQLRGAESEADAAYVSELAGQLNLPAIIEKRDVEAYQAKRRLSLEEAAREVRYEFLAEAARAIGAERVAVGHTLNDQIETILLHIIRGSGTRGLRGLQFTQSLRFSNFDLTVIRPMLETGREETLEFCAERHLQPCADSSNLSLAPLRNRVRTELLPLLKGYNAGISESLRRLGRIAQDEGAFLEAESSRVWTEMAVQENDSVTFPKEAFQKTHPALQRLLLRTSIHKLLGSLKDIEARHIEEIVQVLQKPAGKRIVLPGGLVFRIDYNRFILEFEGGEFVPFPELPKDCCVAIPGQVELPGWQIKAEIVDADGEEWKKGNGCPPNFSAFFDYQKIGKEITIRARRPGDWFQPLGMSESKKVGKFMADSRIPQKWRNRIPVVSSQNQIIWIVGWRIDERVKVTSSTRRILHLSVHTFPEQLYR
jgi:tRNA(Ile)-lysidine synthase